MKKRQKAIEFLRAFLADEAEMRKFSCSPPSNTDDSRYISRAEKAIRMLEVLAKEAA